ncbi:MAG: holo-ACP synthase [Bacilli bacterium]|jgi:holo-[acyl-carrier protein] synthase|uniref:holo-ACP synthase n=1 Tax=unclassified Ureibacillus TaxID=2638520 RepID=UPI001EBA9BDC|nr:holo-ACP synthase [Bacilli bacterium]
MIKGIGLDIVEIERIKELMNRTDKFHKRILSERELDIFNHLSEKRKYEFLAGRFAAKEAFSKANGTGIREGCEFHQIEILNDELGKPVLYFHGQAVNGFVSITHSRDYAAAQVIIMSS